MNGDLDQQHRHMNRDQLLEAVSGENFQLSDGNEGDGDEDGEGDADRDGDDDDLLEEIYQFTSSANRRHNEAHIVRPLAGQQTNNRPTIGQMQPNFNFGNARQVQDQSGNKYNQHSNTDDQNHLEANNNQRYSGGSNKVRRNQPCAHHHQQQTSGLSNQLDDGCSGLFESYQNSRNLGVASGGIDGLNSLGVNSCENVTLGDQIDLLTDDICFGTNSISSQFDHNQVEGIQQQTQISVTNDNFLNVLFLNNNHTQQQQMAYCDSQINGGMSMSPFTDCLENQLIIDEQQSVDPDQGATKLSNFESNENVTEKATNSKSPKLINKTKKSAGPQTKVKNSDCKRKEAKKTSTLKTGKSSGSTHLTVEHQASSQKNPRSDQRAQVAWARGRSGQKSSSGSRQTGFSSISPQESWISSPSSVSDSSMNLSSMPSSGLFMNNINESSCTSISSGSTQLNEQLSETPYKQQLDNLRKKLKMDLMVPHLSSTTQQNKKGVQLKAAASHRQKQRVGAPMRPNDGHGQETLSSDREERHERGPKSTDLGGSSNHCGAIFVRTTSGQILPVSNQQLTNQPFDRSIETSYQEQAIIITDGHSKLDGRQDNQFAQVCKNVLSNPIQQETGSQQSRLAKSRQMMATTIVQNNDEREPNCSNHGQHEMIIAPINTL